VRLPADPRLPIPEWTLDYLRRLTARLHELWRTLTGAINPYLGPAWDDLRFPASGINPAGTANAPTVDTTTYPGTLLFSGSADNHLAGLAQLPHAWLEGSELRPHVHWRKPAADGSGLAVGWELRYSISGINAAPVAYTAWLAGTLAVGNLTAQEHHNITSFPAIDMTGYKGSTCVTWELRRVGSSDAYNSTARFLEFDFHYQVGSSGSVQEYPT
jgi:hypothetical protein